MKMSGPRSLSHAPRTVLSSSLRPFVCPPMRQQYARHLHESPIHPANPLPIVATGPPPAPPQPSVSESRERVDRRRRQAELLKQARALKGTGVAGKPREVLKRRFWKDVSVQRTPEGLHTIHLDSRAVRSPQTKTPLHLPASKPHLASAIAMEWDGLTSAQQALKTHLIPLTSLAARANDVALQDAADTQASTALGEGAGDARRDIVRQLMRYLDTDTLLCWAPPGDSNEELNKAAKAAAMAGPAPSVAAASKAASGTEERPLRMALRDRQEHIAAPIVAYLTTYIWPGAELRPALAENSIMPAPQSALTRQLVQGWMMGLGAWELAGLERAALATKSLCIAARLVCEWSENFRAPAAAAAAAAEAEAEPSKPGETTAAQATDRFGVDEAEQACTMEVRFQTDQWGEVEDSHDVDREDLRRQLGSAVLLVSGTGEN